MTQGPPLRAKPLPEPKPLPANPLPAKLDLANAFKLDVPLDGGGMAMMMRGMARHGRRHGPGPLPGLRRPAAAAHLGAGRNLGHRP